MPSSSDRDLFLRLANELMDGTIEVVKKTVSILAEDDLIAKRLQEITRQEYFKKVVIPFLHGKPTKYKMPKWKRHILPFNLFHMLRRYEKLQEI